jgi:hypothetical protein
VTACPGRTVDSRLLHPLSQALREAAARPVSQLSSPGRTERNELMLWVATIGIESALAGQRERALIAGGIGFPQD